MAKPTYIGWKPGVEGLFQDLDAARIHEEIEEVAKKNGGVAPVEAMVSVWQSNNTHGHAGLEWDNEIAGHEHRKSQARKLMASIEVTYAEAPDVKTRAFEVVRSTPTKGYRRTDLIMSNRSEREELMQRAQRELQSFKKRYASLVELQDVFASIDELMTRQGVAGQ